MKKIVMAMAVVLTMTCNVSANLVWISGHHELTEGSHTFIEMYNDATAEIKGGWVAEFLMYNKTSSVFSGGTIMQILAYDTASLNLKNSTSIDFIKSLGYSSVNISGGSLNILSARDNSIIDIHNGSIKIIDAMNASTITLFAENYQLTPNGGQFRNGLISGTWLNNGESFTIELLGSETIKHITVLPEPASLFFFLFGIPFSMRLAKRFKS